MEYDHERGMSRESPDLFEEEEEFSNPLYSDEDSREEWATLRVDPSTTSAPKTEAIPLNGSRTDAESSKQATGSEKVAPKPGSPDPSPPMTRIGLNDNKAGMEGLDKAKINQIILEASRGSKFYENEVKKEKQVTKRINRMLEELKKITPAQKVAALSAVDRELESLEEGRDLAHIVVHVDMDAFYAAVEMRDDPRLKDVPMAVGGSAMLVGDIACPLPVSELAVNVMTLSFLIYSLPPSLLPSISPYPSLPLSHSLLTNPAISFIPSPLSRL